MEQIWLALSIASGVVFGFLIAWISLRSDRTSIYARGKSDGETERAAMAERLAAKDMRVQEIVDERNRDREGAERLREENAILKAAHLEADGKVTEVRRQAEEKLAMMNDAHQRLVDTLRESLTGKIHDQEARLRAFEVEVDRARNEAETLRHENITLQASHNPLKERTQELDAKLAALAAEADSARRDVEPLRADNVAHQERLGRALERAKDYELRAASLGAELDQKREEADKLRAENARLQTYAAEMDARIEESRRLSDEKLHEVAESQIRLSEVIRTISTETIQQNQQAMLDMTRTAIEKLSESRPQEQGVPAAFAAPAALPQAGMEELIQPLRESLDRVDASLGEIEKRRAATLEGLAAQVAGLAAAQSQLQSETASIAGALRSPSAGTGWSAIQLRRVVELAGLSERCDFESAAGPDLVIQLPGKRHIDVDAKVSLAHFLDASQTADAGERAGKLRQHAESVRGHVTKLAANGHGAEFSVAFLPSESVLGVTLEQDPHLLEYGAENKVLLATPTTLMGLLKAVSYGWQQQKITDNTREVSELGQAVYDRLRTFSGQLDQLRLSLSHTVETYNRTASSFESGVVAGARKFADLGAASGEALPVAASIDSLPHSLQALDVATAEPAVAQLSPVPVEVAIVPTANEPVAVIPVTAGPVAAGPAAVEAPPAETLGLAVV